MPKILHWSLCSMGETFRTLTPSKFDICSITTHTDATCMNDWSAIAFYFLLNDPAMHLLMENSLLQHLGREYYSLFFFFQCKVRPLCEMEGSPSLQSSQLAPSEFPLQMIRDILQKYHNLCAWPLWASNLNTAYEGRQHSPGIIADAWNISLPCWLLLSLRERCFWFSCQNSGKWLVQQASRPMNTKFQRPTRHSQEPNCIERLIF